MSVYADKALEKYNITYKELEKLWSDGYIKEGKEKAKFWSDIYTFEDEQEFNKWKKWCLTKVSEEKFKIIDMLYGLGQPYLFKKEVVLEDDEY